MGKADPQAQNPPWPEAQNPPPDQRRSPGRAAVRRVRRRQHYGPHKGNMGTYAMPAAPNIARDLAFPIKMGIFNKIKNFIKK